MITRRQLGALVALTLMWGVNWPMMKLSLRELTPMYFRAITMTGGALWLYLFYRARGIRMAPQGAEWRAVALLGLPAAILGFTMPIWTVLIGVGLLGERLTGRVAFAASAVALAIGLLVSDELRALAGRPVGVLWMGGAAVSWAIGTLMMRRTRHTLPVEALTVWMMIGSAACIWIIAAATEPLPTLRFTPAMWASLAYGVLINYGFAQIIWFGLARNLPPATSAMSIMAVPMIGTLSAPLIVGEWPRWQDGVAMVCVMAAIAARNPAEATRLMRVAPARPGTILTCPSTPAFT